MTFGPSGLGRMRTIRQVLGAVVDLVDEENAGQSRDDDDTQTKSEDAVPDAAGAFQDPGRLTEDPADAEAAPEEHDDDRIPFAQRVAAAKHVEEARARAAEIVAASKQEADARQAEVTELLEQAAADRRRAASLLTEADDHARSSRQLTDSLVTRARNEHSAVERALADAEEARRRATEGLEEVARLRADLDTERGDLERLRAHTEDENALAADLMERARVRERELEAERIAVAGERTAAGALASRATSVVDDARELAAALVADADSERQAMEEAREATQRLRAEAEETVRNATIEAERLRAEADNLADDALRDREEARQSLEAARSEADAIIGQATRRAERLVEETRVKDEVSAIENEAAIDLRDHVDDEASSGPTSGEGGAEGAEADTADAADGAAEPEGEISASPWDHDGES